MAFTCKEGKMASNVLDTLLASGVAEADMHDGTLVSLGDLVKNDVYSTKTYNYPEYDTYEMDLPEDGSVCIIDYAGISEGDIADNTYRMGVKLHNLVVKADEATRVRRLAKHDKYWIGTDNIKGTAAVGAYLQLKAGDADTIDGLHHVVTGDPVDGKFTAKIIAEREFTIGTHDDGKLYLVEVISL